MLQELSLSMRGFARVAASTGLFAASYDNINLVFRAAEQIMGQTGIYISYSSDAILTRLP
jgi:hypothetical protein